MKFAPLFRSERVWLALMLAVLAVVSMSVWAVLLLRVMEPAPLTWRSISPPIANGLTLTMAAEAVRSPSGDCSNTFQMDIRDGDSVTRLPVPTRVIEGDLSTYQTVLTHPLQPGTYQGRLYESYFCNGVRKAKESPWIEFSVPAVSPPA